MGQPGQTLTPAIGAAGVVALVFRAGALLCALPLDEVIETMRVLDARPLAGTPPYLRGITILRGAPAPVIDIARLLTGGEAEVSRYIAVRAARGPVACATGPVLGIRKVDAMPPEGAATLVTGVSRLLIAGVGAVDGEPLLLLRSIRAVPDQVWEAAAAHEVRFPPTDPLPQEARRLAEAQ